MTDPTSHPSASPLRLLRHTVATLAYRAAKVLRDAPDGFPDHRLAPSSRTPLEILGHLCDLMNWAEKMARGEYVWAPEPPLDWPSACDRFFRALATLDDTLSQTTLTKYPADTIFQGPIADALTHVGQLALIRGAMNSPVRPESYARAEIQVGRVGRDQSSTRREFDGDASKRG